MIHPVRNLLEDINTFGNVYTEFKPDAYLTHTQLNQLTAYFEDSTRLRTDKLVGVGNVCGFEVSNDLMPDGTPYIDLTPGIGITSDSDLIFKDVLSRFTYCIEFNNKMRYDRLMSTAPDHIYELRTENDFIDSPGDQRLALPTDLDKYHVVAFLDSYKVDRELCDIISCDDSGDQVNMVLKFLLVHDTHWNDILMPPDTIFAEHNVFEFYDRLPDLMIQRAVLLPDNCNTSTEVYDIFRNKIDHWQVLRDAIISIVNRFDARSNFGNEGITQASIQNAFDSTFQNLTRKKEIQYLYDHYKDLAETYTQIKSLILFLNVECNPSYEAFPKHLCLHKLGAPYPERYRHRMYHSTLSKDRYENFQKFKSLITRLWKQLNEFSCPDDIEIRITSSRDYDFALDRRAIPYYYDYNSIRDTWDIYRTLRKTQSYIPGYANTNPNTLLNIDHLDKEHYRVEGILDVSCSVALQRIDEIKKTKGLAFDVKTVSIGKGSVNFDWEDYACEFADLKTMLKCWELEFRCLIKGFEKYFGSIDIRDMIYAAAGSVDTEPISHSDNINRSALVEKNDLKVSDVYREEAKKSMTRCQATDAASHKYVPSNASSLMATAIFKSAFMVYGYTIEFYELSRSWSDFLKDGNYLNAVIQNIERFCADREQMMSIMNQYYRELSESTSGYERKFLFPEMYTTYARLSDVCCYISKLNWIKTEIESKKQAILDRLTLSHIVQKNPGAVHKSGVGKGETLLLVYTGEMTGANEFDVANDRIVADFALPYMCCSDCAPTQVVHVADTTTDTDTFEIVNTEDVICEGESFEVRTTENGIAVNLQGNMQVVETGSLQDYTSGNPVDLATVFDGTERSMVTLDFTFPHGLSYSIIVYRKYLPDLEASYDLNSSHFTIQVRNLQPELPLEYSIDGGATFHAVQSSPFSIATDVDVTLMVRTAVNNRCIEPAQIELIVPAIPDVFDIDGPTGPMCDREAVRVFTKKNGQVETIVGNLEIPELSYAASYTSGTNVDVSSLIENSNFTGTSVTLKFSFPQQNLEHTLTVLRSYQPEIQYDYNPNDKEFRVSIPMIPEGTRLEYRLDNTGAWITIDENPFAVKGDRNVQIMVRTQGNHLCHRAAEANLQPPFVDIESDVIEKIKSMKDRIRFLDPTANAFRESKSRITDIMENSITSENYKTEFASGDSYMTLYKDSLSLAASTLESNRTFFSIELMIYFQFIRLLNDDEFKEFTKPYEKEVYTNTKQIKNYLDPQILESLEQDNFKSQKGEALRDMYLKLITNT